MNFNIIKTILSYTNFLLLRLKNFFWLAKEYSKEYKRFMRTNFKPGDVYKIVLSIHDNYRKYDNYKKSGKYSIVAFDLSQNTWIYIKPNVIVIFIGRPKNVENWRGTFVKVLYEDQIYLINKVNLEKF